jgi:hypothetical protein
VEKSLASFGVAVAEGGEEETELELVGRSLVATDATTQCFLEMEPGDVVKYGCRPFFSVHQVLSGAGAHQQQWPISSSQSLQS